ncbi:uncharacterized protein VP01_2496g1 [Puccinia sorghi]|uniref:Uncharacterized protein n=1 Tax=Puccinia sorghi TaxID=27349 RepID=A0A0L6V7L1_9BASI|nr:uncharacterized protein VP01_2496g1 [Puccinia sorghi]
MLRLPVEASTPAAAPSIFSTGSAFSADLVDAGALYNDEESQIKIEGMALWGARSTCRSLFGRRSGFNGIFRRLASINRGVRGGTVVGDDWMIKISSAFSGCYCTHLQGRWINLVDSVASGGKKMTRAERQVLAKSVAAEQARNQADIKRSNPLANRVPSIGLAPVPTPS